MLMEADLQLKFVAMGISRFRQVAFLPLAMMSATH